jgi:hypothetical protein
VGRPRKLHCHWCSGGHVSSDCPNRDGKTIRLFGAVVDGRYVPPPGVKVRIMQLPYDIHGDRLTTILKELDP